MKQSKYPTVFEMVADRLKTDGFDGLYNPDAECACLLDDLEPCLEMDGNCTAGFKGPCNCGMDCGFHIGTKAAGNADGFYLRQAHKRRERIFIRTVVSGH